MPNNEHVFDAIAIGAGVAGIYQIKTLQDHGFDAILLEANDDLGGTWFKNRYPGCRFDSESYSYGYAFSRELIDEWHWKEHFSPQPENLKYLNYVADKFDLRKHMKFGASVASMIWDEAARIWTITLHTTEQYKSRFVITCIGVLSVPFTPTIPGQDDFEGQSFHSFDWPTETLDLSNSRVGVMGTGATGIQIIGALADQVKELTVFQRHPNWSVPLNNAQINEQEMAEIRARYDDILAACEESQGGFVHLPDRRGYHNLSVAERRALWDELYDKPGFSLLLANFPETFLEAEPNKALSDYVAQRIRARVDDPAIAEKLIPTNHGFGMKRLPLETRYFEAYNQPHVHLVDISETPIQQISANGIQTTDKHHDLDVLVYATGFHAITGGLNKIDIHGSTNQTLKQKWENQTSTYLGLMTHGFPNMLMVAGPQSVSGSTNYPRTIEIGVDWITRLLQHARECGTTRFEVNEDAEARWGRIVQSAQERTPFSNVKSWFTGYAPNQSEDAQTTVRYNAFWGGGPKYRSYLAKAEEASYADISMS